MLFKTIDEVRDFLDCVNNAHGQVWLEDKEGNKINLKSSLSQYIAISALLTDHGSDMELFCQLTEDEHLFYGYFLKHPSVEI